MVSGIKPKRVTGVEVAVGVLKTSDLSRPVRLAGVLGIKLLSCLVLSPPVVTVLTGVF